MRSTYITYKGKISKSLSKFIMETSNNNKV